MPQMAPTWWWGLFLFVTLMLILLITFSHYFYLSPKKEKSLGNSTLPQDVNQLIFYFRSLH